MPMGLKNAPATFQRLMDQIERGLDCKETLVYMDDVIIHARSLVEHDKRVRQFFSHLAYTNLTEDSGASTSGTLNSSKNKSRESQL